jgi:hypothetical protein
MTGVTPGPGSFSFKDGGIFMGWLAGLILIGCMMWVFTQPLRSTALMRSANRVLLEAQDPRRLGEPLPLAALSGTMAPIGTWYALTGSGDRAVVFSVIADGICASYIAMISNQGRVESLIPLSGHLERLPREILRPYIRRIETALGGI